MLFEIPPQDVQSIKVMTGDDVQAGAQAGEYNAFRIEIKTAAGTWVVEGCHDMEATVYDPNGNEVA